MPIPLNYAGLHITQLEMLNVVVALKIWAEMWKDTKIAIYCDNLAVVEVLTSGRTKDPYLATCARNIWLLCAIFNIKLNVIHIPGKNNTIADLLSRWDSTIDPISKLLSLLPNFQWINTDQSLLNLNAFI